MSGSASILLIDDDPFFLRGLSRNLQNQGYDVHTAENGRSGLVRARRGGIDVALVDWNLPDMNGGQVVEGLRKIDFAMGIIAITGEEGSDKGKLFLQAGANRYFAKNEIHSQEFFDALHKQVAIAQNHRGRATEGVGVPKDARPAVVTALKKLAGKSPAMLRLKAEVAQLAGTPGIKTVLLTGESGVGKTFVARALHAAREDGDLPYFEQNCANLTENTLGPTLFGTEGGVFTGVEKKKGALREHNGGTIFLDEIGTVPPDIQARLLTLVQDRIYSPIGSTRTAEFDGLIVFATNEDLAARVRDRTFRKDLLYRINTHRIEIPPLRDRLEDVETLAYVFLDKYVDEYHRDIRHISAEAMHLLRTHRYAENNVRELESVINRAVARGMGRYLEAEHLEFDGGHDPTDGAPPPPLPPPGRAAPAPAPAAPRSPAGGLERFLEEDYAQAKDALLAEWTTLYCRHKLARASGNKTYAAELAGMARPNFMRLLRRYEVDTSDLSGQDLRAGLDRDDEDGS